MVSALVSFLVSFLFCMVLWIVLDAFTNSKTFADLKDRFKTTSIYALLHSWGWFDDE